MKFFISIYILLSSHVMAGVVSGDDTWRALDVVDMTSKSGTVTGDDTWKVFDDLAKVGEYDYDSTSNRWMLKTKTRVLSVKKIELIDKYRFKQEEVDSSKENIKIKYSRFYNEKLLEKKLKNTLKFKNYILNDFKY
ncbi:hypothetical protein [Halobacteriovorax sp. DA5]|uniref:hypothetical protein n=1 Tax=Halobacteriovorax sp. DA5 TaxID=2067553 RepID=UPI0011AFCEA6|nr:hypothetical protein [Halobacteriovorax sp. DA5]